MRRKGYRLEQRKKLEIWEYIGEQRSKCVCKVKEEKDVECYKRATEELQNYGRE